MAEQGLSNITVDTLREHADKPSRIDMQVMIDVPAAEFIRLFEEGHVVTKLRKGSIDFTNGRCVNKETLTLYQISGNRAEPCRQMVGVSQIAQFLPSDQKGFLCKVFRLVKIASGTEQHTTDERLVLPHNLGKCSCVSAACQFNGCRCVVRGWVFRTHRR